MEVNLPDMRAEVEAAFARYEAAPVANDIATLTALFWDDPRTIRYGTAENLYGGAETNHSRLIHEAVCAALAGRSPVLRSDGSPERDFLYVEDAARAYLAIWDALGRGQGAGEAFNAGGGEPHRVREVVDLICRLAGSDVSPEVQGRGNPHGEIDRQWLDSARLRDLTGWVPQVELKDGLRRTVEWYRSHPAACGGQDPF